MHIGEYIRYRRKALGYTQQRLADFLSVSKQAVHKWEKCLTIPDIMILPQLASALKIPPQHIVEMIWLGESEAAVVHFVHVTVTEKNGEDYVLKTFESKEFLPAAELFETICNGRDQSVFEKLADYYAFDSSRAFHVELTETEYDIYGELPIRSLLIDSCELNAPVLDCEERS